MAENVKCKTCGANVPAGMKFCASCGAAVERTEVSAATSKESNSDNNEGGKRRGLNLNKLIIPAVIIIAVLGIAFVSLSLLKPDKYGKIVGKISITNDRENNVVIIYPNGKGKSNIDGECELGQYNFEETKAAFLIREEEGDEGSSLYLVTDEVKLIDDNVHRFSFSASGNAIAYVKNFDSAEKTGELWLYYNNKKDLINEKAEGKPFISPKGSAIGYVAYDGGDKVGYVWDGKEHEIGEDTIPIAVSDGAKYIYYKKTDTLYVQKGTKGDEREKLSEIPLAISLMLNKDLSQVIYSKFDENEGTKSYISRSGGEGEFLSDQMIGRLIIPSGTKRLSCDYDLFTFIDLYPVSDFSDTFGRTTGTSCELYRITQKYDAINIGMDIDTVYSGVFLADDGKTMIYSRDGSVYKINGMEENPNPERIFTGDVLRFLAVSDGSAVFYVKNNNEIYYKKGKDEPTLVSDDQIDENSPKVAQSVLLNGKTLYYAIGNELYFSEGAKGKLVNEFEFDIYGVSIEGGAVIVSTYIDERGYDPNIRSYEQILHHYRSTDGKNFELVEAD
ncbi:MAG: zinc ribbon domain-containing protein [Clostridiales bacterium]|jgi:hypothetical protein|nr:zinc ribbon domain-containing protein [Clostridiales bacterium]